MRPVVGVTIPESEIDSVFRIRAVRVAPVCLRATDLKLARWRNVASLEPDHPCASNWIRVTDDNDCHRDSWFEFKPYCERRGHCISVVSPDRTVWTVIRTAENLERKVEDNWQA